MKVNNSWRIRCNHTPEIIDRILMPIRKRGLGVNKMSYEKQGEEGLCTIDIEIEEDDASRIYKNLIRITDILEVEKL